MDPSPWTLVALVLSRLALAAAAVRHDPQRQPLVLPVGAVALALAAAAGVAGAGQPLWVVVAALGAVTVVAAVAALVGSGVEPARLPGAGCRGTGAVAGGREPLRPRARRPGLA